MHALVFPCPIIVYKTPDIPCWLYCEQRSHSVLCMVFCLFTFLQSLLCWVSIFIIISKI